MKTTILVISLLLVPVLALGGTHVQSISLSPQNPDPMSPFRIYVVVELPDQCWSQGPVGDLQFTDLDSYDGEACSGGLFYYDIAFEMEGLPEGVHSFLVSELHESSRDPGPYLHSIEVVVGDPIIGTESRAWGSIKSLYR